MPNRQQLHIHNIYIPPRSSCSAGHNASIAHLLSNNEMSHIAGDINAHHSRWDTNKIEDGRGELIADVIDTADYTILNENEATRLPTNGRSTSPDISLASNAIALLSDRSVSTPLTSDHLPILITMNSELNTIYGPRRTYNNFMKADWARHAEACDEYHAEAGEARTVKQAVKTYRKAVNKASGLFNPVGRIRNLQPTLPTSEKSFAYGQDRKRRISPTDGMLSDLNRQSHKLEVVDKRTTWQSADAKYDHRTGISHQRRLVNGLSGKKIA